MPNLDPDRFKNLLGQTLNYQGIPCQVIEILADPPSLVLRGRPDHPVIQPNQYGDAGDWMTETFTVALLNPRRDGLNPALPALTGFDLLI